MTYGQVTSLLWCQHPSEQLTICAKCKQFIIVIEIVPILYSLQLETISNIFKAK
jgi:hypothetical protein